MLLITRKEGERVRLTVTGQDGEQKHADVYVMASSGRVQLGFAAPHDFFILRGELDVRGHDQESGGG
jgi:sRNA-binding carbon storage regulator CsrA